MRGHGVDLGRYQLVDTEQLRRHVGCDVDAEGDRVAVGVGDDDPEVLVVQGAHGSRWVEADHADGVVGVRVGLGQLDQLGQVACELVGRLERHHDLAVVVIDDDGPLVVAVQLRAVLIDVVAELGDAQGARVTSKGQGIGHEVLLVLWPQPVSDTVPE